MFTMQPEHLAEQNRRAQLLPGLLIQLESIIVQLRDLTKAALLKSSDLLAQSA